MVKIKLKSGNGGEGIISFDNRGRAWGGDGGNGAEIILKGDVNIYDLGRFDSTQIYKAEDGGKGQTYCKHGKNGDPLVLKVPLVTKVYDLEDNLLCTIEKQDQEYTILFGGDGGLGNFTLRGNHWDGKLSRK